METLIYIIILLTIFWIIGWLFEKYTDKMFSCFIYSLISLEILGSVAALIVSYTIGKSTFLFVFLLVFLCNAILVVLLTPKPVRDDKKHKKHK